MDPIHPPQCVCTNCLANANARPTHYEVVSKSPFRASVHRFKPDDPLFEWKSLPLADRVTYLDVVGEA